MPEDADKNLKIRFRFPGGEEFEAQGTPEFIEKQRNYFLDLIGKRPTAHPAVPQKTTDLSFTTAPHSTAKPIDADTTSAGFPSQHNSAAQAAFPAKRLWEKLLKEEGGEILLRRKMRLEAQDAALLLLAGARVLLNQPACKALYLSQVLQKSGFSDVGRLDRLLQKEIYNGYLQSDGIKRGRTYSLTNAGFARAFVLAEKLAGELL